MIYLECYCLISNSEGYHLNPSENKSEEYQSNVEKRRKRKIGKQQETRWKDQIKASIFPTHLLPPKSDPPTKVVPVAVAAELKSYVDQARVLGMQQIDGLVYYDSNSDDDDDDEGDDNTFCDAIQVEDGI